jgi:subtilisin family serine protease
VKGFAVFEKLDPELRVLLRSRQQPHALAAAAAEKQPTKILHVIVQFTGPLEDLAKIGFDKMTVVEHAIEHYKVATGSIPVEQLEALASIGHVLEVEAPQPLFPMLNYSRPEIHADLVQSGHPGFTGNGVVIGVIDSGIDWRHGAFRKPNGDSRVLAVWDQVARGVPPGTTPGPGGIGAVYTNFAHPEKGPNLDDIGHGTHVSGIAAGNGRPACCCAGSGTYVGIAPEASLAVVRHGSLPGEELGESLTLINAIDFIFNTAALGKTAVVNISLGANRGAHDGTSGVERAINAFIAGHTGRAIVVAAGNFGDATGKSNTRDSQLHTKGTVPGNGHVEIEFNIAEGQSDHDAFLDLWYQRAGTLNLALTANDGTTTTGPVAHGTHWPPAGHPGIKNLATASVEGRINGEFGRDNNFRIKLGRLPTGMIPHGDGWKIRLDNPNAVAVTFHCWIEHGAKPPVFLPAVTPAPDQKIRATSDTTLSVPATALEAIVVANHQNKTSCWNCWPSGDIDLTSSRGPVARVAAGQPNDKPSIAAPGLQITSVKADVCTLPGNCCSCWPDACWCQYFSDDGTSMSAPHVAGTIALMLEKNPGLNKEFILKHLQQSAAPPPAGGAKETWGAGKLDAKAAVDAVPFPVGGGGGNPTIRRMNPAEEEAGSSLPPSVRIVRARLAGIPNGLLMAYVISRNFSEVRRLINSNRRIATLWHRSQGPAILRRLMNGAIDENAPPAILADEQLTCLKRWFDILRRYGSRRLQDSIDRHRDAIANLLLSPLAAQAANGTEQAA